MWLSGAQGEELTATLALCMGVFDPIQPPTSVRGIYTRSLRKKRKKRRKEIRASHGPRWRSLMSEVFWLQSGNRGIGRWCSKGPEDIV